MHFQHSRVTDEESSFKYLINCETAPSFAKSPKSQVFERVLTRGREMGERGEEGVTRPGKREMGREGNPQRI